MRKLRLYIDMDGVLCDFYNTAQKMKQDNPKVQYPQGTWGFFENLPPIPGAIEAYKKLEEYFDVRILTKASEFNIGSYSGKAYWVLKNLGFEAQCKMNFSGDKASLIGDILVDDQLNANQANFKGILIRFGTEDSPNWDVVYKQLIELHMKHHTLPK